VRRRLGATEYTVGWICALPIELAAAQVMLDEEHLPHDSIDSSQYTLDRIGGHNAVVACLPAGQMEIGPAAFSAGQTMSKFRSTRFGLMVGVGGGAPSAEADIRLDDVVVSQPYKQHGGVVHWEDRARWANDADRVS
jgi:nucleoside phosphorylase